MVGVRYYEFRVGNRLIFGVFIIFNIKMKIKDFML